MEGKLVEERSGAAGGARADAAVMGVLVREVERGWRGEGDGREGVVVVDGCLIGVGGVALAAGGPETVRWGRLCCEDGPMTFLGEEAGLGFAIVWRMVKCGVVLRERGGWGDVPGEDWGLSPIMSFRLCTLCAVATCHGDADFAAKRSSTSTV